MTPTTPTTPAAPPLTPARLWKRMTADQRLGAARAFWQSDEAGDDQVQAVLLIAQHKKFRPKTVMSLDEERRAKNPPSLPPLPETMAPPPPIVYHPAAQRPEMGGFFYAPGIGPEGGGIQAGEGKPHPPRL